MNQVNIYEAKTQFSKLVERAESGEEIVIARGGRQVAKLTAISSGRAPVRFGLLKGKIRIAEDFDADLPEEILAAFGGHS